MGADLEGGVARVGIMGGSFDPIHLGHLAAAEEARVALGLAQVLFVPCGDPYHRQAAPLASREDRYQMTVLATADNPHFIASRIEIERPGPSYTIDTVRALKQASPQTDYYVILGADAVALLLTWREHEALLQECCFVVVSREGNGQTQARSQVPPAFLERSHWLDMPSLDISSTTIRRRVSEGKPIRYLVPRAVEQYIEQRGLYR